MNDDGEPSRTRPVSAIAWPGVLVLVAAGLAYFGHRAPLETARPKSAAPYQEPPPPTVEEIPAVHARLWEDPLAAAYRDGGDGTSTPLGVARKPGCASLAAVLTKAVTEVGQFDAAVETPLQGHFRRLAEAKENQPLLVMPVLVPGGPYAEDREQRMRTRYAVLAALGRCGYQLALPTRMSYVTVPVCRRMEAVKDDVSRPVKVPVKLYRRDSLADKRGSQAPPRFAAVQVLWLNETQLGDRPLRAIAQILDGLFPSSLRDRLKNETTGIHLRIIGPSSSDTLLAMRDEPDWRRDSLRALLTASLTESLVHLCTSWDATSWKAAWQDWLECGWQRHPWTLDDFADQSKIFSPRATVWEDVLRDRSRCGLRLSNLGVDLVRVIGSDERLVRSLQAELGCRDAWPDGEGSPKHVVLITERDTLYGRALPKTFGRFMPEDNLHVLTYLRGIDGALSTDGTAGGKEKKGQQADSGDEKADREVPEGRSQLDYLRRLEGQLTRLEQGLNRQGGARIAAIGVVGSDFYDKLLVLRALRARFPRTWFFTTDVEAGFAHPSEYDYARNLLVASHFGLELHEKLQGDVPPFRDSYQTAAFFAVLLALENDEVKKQIGTLDVDDPWGPTTPTTPATQGEPDAKKPSAATSADSGGSGQPCGEPGDPLKHLEPLVFEIARQGPYQLTLTGGLTGTEVRDRGVEAQDCLSATARVHRISPREGTWRFSTWKVVCIVLVVAGILGCLAMAHAQTRIMLKHAATGVRESVLWVGWPVLLVAGGILRVCRTGYNQIQSPVAGKWRQDMQSWWGRQAAFAGRRRIWEPLLTVVAAVSVYMLIRLILRDHRSPGGEPLVFFEGISVWPSMLLRLLAFLLGIVFFVKGCRDLKEDLREMGTKYFGVAEGPPLSFGPQRWTSPRAWTRGLSWSFQVLRLPWPGQGKGVRADELYRTLAKKGSCCCRALRASGMTVFYFLLLAGLFALAGAPNTPFRGSDSRAACMVTVLLAVLTMLALVFLVLDATLLCRRFIKTLSQETEDWPKAAIKAEVARRGKCQAKDLRELLIVRVIAERTRTVSGLLLYPCIIVAVMYLSRNRLLDCWDYPWPLMLAMLLIPIIAALCAMVLHRDAERERRHVLERLNDNLSEAIVKPAKQRVEQLRLIMTQVIQERRGAFSPLGNNPILKALAIPAGGVLLLEQLLNWL